MTAGLASTLLIYLWVNDELQVNKFNVSDARIYQVMSNAGGDTPGVLAEALATEFPEVEYASAVVPPEWFSEDGILEVDGKKIKSKAEYVGKDYFKIFTGEFLKGNGATALNDKHAMLVSQEMAIKLFGAVESAPGKTVEWMDNLSPISFIITGVFKNASNNTTPAEIILNYELFLDSHDWLRQWPNSDPRTYVLLRDGTDVTAFGRKIAGFIKSKYPESRSRLIAQRFSENYLHGRFENGLPAGGRIEYVRLFVAIAIFILVIACINFMNLSTARASRRLKEVGIKKAIGASRAGLFIQHIEESLIMAFMSLIIAVVLVLALLSQFNQITGKHLSLEPNVNLILSFVGIVLFTGFVAGSYPAIYLSGFRPAEVLKGKLATSWSELWIRKGLVVFQFAISILLAVCVVVVYMQIQFVHSKNLGYNRDNIIHFNAGVEMTDVDGKRNTDDPAFFDLGGKHDRQMETLLREIRILPGVINASNYEHDLTGRHGGIQGVSWKEGKEDDKMYFNNLQVGNDFVPTMGIQLLEGRSFSSERSGELSKVIFNEEAIKAMGITDPIGKVISVWGQDKEIIGVAKNFNMESLFEQISPTIIQLEPRSTRIMVKIKSGEERSTIASLEKIYNSRTPGLSFDYSFVDDDYNALYISEQRVSVLSGYFALLAILISALGLFGLSAFTAERRRKEIGIRKILGASERGIVLLLSGEFSKIILVAILIAIPISIVVTRNWLNSFAYSIPLHWWFFAAAALMAVFVPLLAVGIQTVKASMLNPAQSLKEE